MLNNFVYSLISDLIKFYVILAKFTLLFRSNFNSMFCKQSFKMTGDGWCFEDHWLGDTRIMDWLAIAIHFSQGGKNALLHKVNLYSVHPSPSKDLFHHKFYTFGEYPSIKRENLPSRMTIVSLQPFLSNWNHHFWLNFPLFPLLLLYNH